MHKYPADPSGLWDDIEHFLSTCPRSFPLTELPTAVLAHLDSLGLAIEDQANPYYRTRIRFEAPHWILEAEEFDQKFGPTQSRELHPTQASARFAILKQILPNIHAFHAYRSAVGTPASRQKLSWWRRLYRQVWG